MQDSTYLGVMQYYKDSLLGFIEFYKQDGSWIYSSYMEYKDMNTKSAFFTTYLTCRNTSSDVFTIRTTSFKTLNFWGYLKGELLHIVKFRYGQVAHYSDFDEWATKMIPQLEKR